MPSRSPATREQKLHAAIVAAAAIVAVVMVGAAAWALTRPAPPGAHLPRDTRTVADGSVGSSGTANPSTDPLQPSGQATLPADADNPSNPSVPATTPPVIVRSIAFHIGRTLYIASEDGSHRTPMHVTGTNYALSPDGRTVAAVEKGKLVVAMVGEHLLASSPVKPGLAAEAQAPVWLPDSSAVLFIRASGSGAPRVWRYDLGTGASSEVDYGTGVALSPDGRMMATLPAEDVAVPVVSVAPIGGTGATFATPSGDPVALAMSASRVFVSTVSASGVSQIWSYAHDGSGKKLIVGSGVEGSAATYGELMLSPDGTKLLYAADGDDGYSRLWIVPIDGGKATAISGRRDDYAIGWTRDGKSVLLIEGNTFQGQVSSLWRSDLTGRYRKQLVKGAML